MSESERFTVVTFKAHAATTRGVGPFGAAAPEFFRLGIAAIPVDEQKRPLIRYGRWKSMPATIAQREFVARFSDANVGIEMSTSLLSVVDVDQPGERALAGRPFWSLVQLQSFAKRRSAGSRV